MGEPRPAWARGLPDGVEFASGRARGARRSRLARLAPFAGPLAEAGFGPDGGERLRPSGLAGRRPLGELAADGASLLVRSYEHGGLLRAATGRRFADPDRPFRELALSAELERRGLATARVVAARARPAPLAGWWLDLVSVRVERAQDLGAWLAGLGSAPVAAVRRHGLARAVGDFLARAHAVGFAHADLQPKNLLARERADGGIDVVAIDLDRSRLAPRLDARARRANLARLLRSVRRRGDALHRTDLARAMRTYAQRLATEPGAALGVGDWREEARAVEAELSRGLARHRLGWWLERLAARVKRTQGSA